LDCVLGRDKKAQQSPRWDDAAPGFFPLRGVRLGTINRQGIMAFPCQDAFGKTSILEPLSQRWRDQPGVHGQGERGEIKPCAMPRSLQTGEHGNSSSGFMRMVTPWLRTKEPRKGQRHMMDRSDHAESIVSTNHLMASTPLPTPGCLASIFRADQAHCCRRRRAVLLVTAWQHLYARQA
jgi:hypothetical protein